MAEKVIVTGGAGFIGSHLSVALMREGYEVVAVDNFSRAQRKNDREEIPYVESDIRDTQRMCEIFAGARFVFHLAARPEVQYSIEHPQETHDINVTGTLSVLEAARVSGVTRVIFSASAASYGNQHAEILTENMIPQPTSPYGLQKYIGELYCNFYSRVYGVSTVSLRYFNVYGPGAHDSGAYALVTAIFLRQKIAGESMTITGDGTQERDFVHVEDIARANILAATSSSVGQGEIINIGSGVATSVNRVAELFGGSTKFIPARLEPHRCVADIANAKELLEWTPTISLEEGIARLLHTIS